MDAHEPWRPKLKNAPLFNPFESSMEWTAQIGGADRIEIEDEAATPDPKPDEPETQKTDTEKSDSR